MEKNRKNTSSRKKQKSYVNQKRGSALANSSIHELKHSLVKGTRSCYASPIANASLVYSGDPNIILLPYKKNLKKCQKILKENGNNISEKLQVVDRVLGEELRMLHHPKRKEVLHDSKS